MQSGVRLGACASPAPASRTTSQTFFRTSRLPSREQASRLPSLTACHEARQQRHSVTVPCCAECFRSLNGTKWRFEQYGRIKKKKGQVEFWTCAWSLVCCTLWCRATEGTHVWFLSPFFLPTQAIVFHSLSNSVDHDAGSIMDLFS